MPINPTVTVLHDAFTNSKRIVVSIADETTVQEILEIVPDLIRQELRRVLSENRQLKAKIAEAVEISLTTLPVDVLIKTVQEAVKQEVEKLINKRTDEKPRKN